MEAEFVSGSCPLAGFPFTLFAVIQIGFHFIVIKLLNVKIVLPTVLHFLLYCNVELHYVV